MKNKKNEEFMVLEYAFQEEKKKYHKIKFIETGHEQLATETQIKNGTCYDLLKKKKQKMLETQAKLKERTRLTKKSVTPLIDFEHLKNKRVLSIDLATRSVGVAYAVNGDIVRWKTIIKTGNDFRQRAFEIVNEIVKILETGQVDFVLLEDTYLGLNSDILAKLSETRGMLTYHLKRLEIDFHLVPASYWKKRFKEVPKERTEQKEYMKKLFFEYTGVKADSDDSADAYMMLKGVLMS